MVRARIWQRGDSQYLCYYFDGKEHRKSLGRIPNHLAERIRKEKEAEITLAKLRGGTTAIGLAPASMPTVAQYLPTYLQFVAVNKTSDDSGHLREIERAFRLQLLPAFGDMALDEIDETVLNDWIRRRSQDPGRLDEHVSAHTVRNEYRKLAALLRRAFRDRCCPLEAVPFDADVIRLPGIDIKPVYFTDGEMGSLYQVAEDPGRSMWRVYRETGARLSELLRVTEGDIDDGQIILTWRKNRLGEWRERVVPLTDAASGAVSRLLEEGNGRLVAMQKRQVQRQFVKDRTAAGIPARRRGKCLGIHILRHSFCSALAMKGRSMLEIAQLAGHSSIAETTRLYVHLSPEHKRRVLS